MNEFQLEKIKISLSKNGHFISNLITYGLMLKNLKNHYSIVKKNKYVKGTKRMSSPYKTLKQLIKMHPEIENKTAMIQDRSITYNELLDEQKNLARYLHYILECKKGENISICAESSIEGIISFFAINQLGLVNARIFNGSQEYKMQENLLNFHSKTIITDSNNLNILSNVASFTLVENVVIMDGCNEEQLIKFKEKNPSINLVDWKTIQEVGSEIQDDYIETVYEDDLASILYTSGSNGEPKPISISNEVYNNMVDIVCNTTNIKKCDNEKVVGVVSHEYPYAAINSTIMILLMGKTLVMPRHNENGILDFDELLAQRPERIQAIPNFYKLLEMAQKNGNLKTASLAFLSCIVSGGEVYLMPEKMEILKFLSKMNCNPLLIDGFGFGELGSATALKFGLNEYFLLMNGIEAKAINPETMETLPNDQEGILCFSSSTIADGYYNNEEATYKSFRTDENGKKWFISDTYGSVHGKLKRLIRLGGRIREYFITGDGKGNFVKVYAGNVEDVIAASGIVEDCVVVPSDMNGTPSPVAYISLKTDCNMTEEEIIEHVMLNCKNLETFAQPTEIKIEEEIKRTDAKKKDYQYYRNKQLEN